MLQVNKQERDLKKAIQAEDARIKDEEDEDIRAELDDLTYEATKVRKSKSYWNERIPEKDISSGLLDEPDQIRVDALQKVHGSGRGHPLRAVKGKLKFFKRRRGMIQRKRPFKAETTLRVVREEVLTQQGK